MRIFRHPSRPGPRNHHYLGHLLPALRAAHPQRELLKRHLPANQSGERLGLHFTARTTLAHHPHKKISEAIIQPLDVRQHAHGRIVLTASIAVHAVQQAVLDCIAHR